MPPESSEPVDLLDLKLLPAWVKETPDAKEYAHYEGETEERPRGRDRGPRREGDRNKKPRTPNGPSRTGNRPTSKSDRPRGRRDARDRPRPDRAAAGGQDRHRAPERPPLEVAVRFVPHPTAFESVAAQIKAESLAYSLFALARLFLQKPE